ncbi:MAG: hypothetical protein E6I56_10585 [Chloroflexi bacterium]|nr:MAG: hypothetical protein E6I56_10585 [Chloroflexota bacterium]
MSTLELMQARNERNVVIASETFRDRDLELDAGAPRASAEDSDSAGGAPAKAHRRQVDDLLQDTGDRKLIEGAILKVLAELCT